MKRAEFIKLWVEALRSGEYKQTKATLVDTESKTPKYCCLGVACEIVNKNRKTQLEFVGKNYLPYEMQKLLGIKEGGAFVVPIEIRGKSYASLVHLNDGGVKFKTIARIIEEQMEAKNFQKP